MSNTVEVKILNKGLEKEQALMNKLGKASVKVGIQSDAGKHKRKVSDKRKTSGKRKTSEADMLDIAVWNEFGTAKTPSRPFIRQCFEDNKEAVAQHLGRTFSVVAQGGRLETELANVGQWYQDRQKNTLKSYPWTPNAPSTRKRKKSSKPLIDTSQLINSIRYKVET